MLQFECSMCGAKMEAKKLPRGWKHYNEQDICSKCVKKHFILRAIAFPIASVVDGEWSDFYADLVKMWGQTTNLSNWLVSEYYSRDIKREPGMTKLPSMEAVNLYQSARERFPELPSKSVTAIDHAVVGKYKEHRYEVLWKAGESTPNFRYPVPFPVPNQAWGLEYQDGCPCVSFRLNDQRWTVRLRGGKEFARQLAGFRQLFAGEAIKGELAVYRKSANSGDHRNRMSERDSTGKVKKYVTMIKLVGYFPKRVKSLEKSGPELRVIVGEDHLLSVLSPLQEDPLLIEMCDQLPRWCAEHSRKLYRWSCDNRTREKFQSQADTAVNKYNNRLTSLCHEVASHVVSLASRVKAPKIVYDDTQRGFCPGFRWYTLKEKIAEKCDAENIEFEWLDTAKKADAARTVVTEEN